MNSDSDEYLIIGGTTKAGTTSLFSYLAAHPEVNPATFKETRFFLDTKYPLDSKFRFDIDGLEKYSEFFNPNAKGRIRLEATPDYLYSEGCAEKIVGSLKKLKMIFILRDPIERLYSWYKFSQQDGLIEKKVTFEKYVQVQLNKAQDNSQDVPQHMRALVQGRYAEYVKRFMRVLGRENCLIVELKDLERSPIEVMSEICRFAAVSDDFYKFYKFNVKNQTRSMRFPRIHGFYKYLTHHMRKRTHKHPALHTMLKKVRVNLEKIYLWMNAEERAEQSVPYDLRRMLERFYEDDQRELKKILRGS